MSRADQHLSQREFWVRIRRALILIVDTIEDQYALPHARPAELPQIAPAPHHNGAAPQSEIPRHDAQSRSNFRERDRV